MTNIEARSGFATILAITLVGLVAAALASMGVLANMDFRRTAEVRAQAQLRQLLLVGAVAAGEKLKENGTGASSKGWSVELPKEISANGTELSIDLRIDVDHSASAHIRAGAGAHMARQDLSFRQINKGWQLTDAQYR